MTDILEVTDLEVTYQRSIRALHGVNLRVEKGQIAALLGANGAGKSTTLRAISGFIGLDNARVTAGNVRYFGEDITGLQLPKTIHKGIVLVPERDKVFTNLTVAENLEVVSATRAEGSNWRQIEDEIFVYFPRLAKLRNKPAGLLSGGERQMLAIGSALVCKPSLLLIDELSLGLAPVIVDEIIERLRDIHARTELSILLVEQSAAVAFALASYGFVLENGKVELEGATQDLRTNQKILELYLGTGSAGRADYLANARRRREERANV
ncbi:MAG: ABC transporter ATP-binding protein [Maritimibacter sp.]|uniref:ABC transporter ATP-binding protein n=1 Tax=Maritimibacter sp. TaxID=2003363 RepID=UPI001D6C15BC|nr:ABC transporter ATP-binding protein [Maritimibacter sp.]MBL6429952.1 ABC transporter ATP-binding protein [Maritimibacter sp.]